MHACIGMYTHCDTAYAKAGSGDNLAPLNTTLVTQLQLVTSQADLQLNTNFN